MQTSTESWPGRIALMLAHCAGMVDLVALPVWVGALIAQYHFTPPQAGGLATLFLVGAVLSSLFFAPRFNRIDSRTAAIAGFGAACLAFLGAAFVFDFAALAALHFVAGASVGCALSFTHGTIARSANPHRLFAIVGMALGVFAIVFLGTTPNLIAAFGGPVLFRTFSVIMVVAAVGALVSFPTATAHRDEDLIDEVTHLRPAVWFGVAGISCMALTQAMMFSFLERIGIDRGFGREAVTGVLIALGFVNLFPAPLAAFLENRVSPRAVLFVGPICQALIAARNFLQRRLSCVRRASGLLRRGHDLHPHLRLRGSGEARPDGARSRRHPGDADDRGGDWSDPRRRPRAEFWLRQPRRGRRRHRGGRRFLVLERPRAACPHPQRARPAQGGVIDEQGTGFPGDSAGRHRA